MGLIDWLLGRDRQKPRTTSNDEGTELECGHPECEEAERGVRKILGRSPDTAELVKFISCMHGIEALSQNMREQLRTGTYWPTPGHYGLYAQVVWALSLRADREDADAGVKPSVEEVHRVPDLVQDYGRRMANKIGPQIARAHELISQLEDPLTVAPDALATEAVLTARQEGDR